LDCNYASRQIYHSLNDVDGDTKTFDVDTSSSASSSPDTSSSHIFTQASETSLSCLASKALSKSCEVLLNVTQIVLDARVTFFYRTIAALPEPHSSEDKHVEQTHIWKRTEVTNASGKTRAFIQFTLCGESWFRNIFTAFKLTDNTAVGVKVFDHHMFALLMERNHEVCDNALTYLRNHYGTLTQQTNVNDL
jgi:hypothetical protein